MFYEELYAELGKLFYYLAAKDGKVREAEKKSLHQLIQNTWKPLENSTDRFGTDQANFIDFSFDYEEEEGFLEDEFPSFEEFFHANRSRFTPVIINNILTTCKAIASAYRGTNRNEQEALNRIVKLFES